MNLTLKEGLDRKKIITALLLSVSISAVLCAFFGELMLPAFAAFYAILILVDGTRNKLMSIIAGAVSLLISAASFALELGTLAIPFACVCAWITAYAFSRGISKGELSVYLTLVCSLMIALTAYLIFASAAGTYDFAAVIEYAKEQYVLLRDVFVEAFMTSAVEQLPELVDAFDENTVAMLFDSVCNLCFSAIVIAAFAFSGFALKIFSGLVYKLMQNGGGIVYWRFATSNLIAYFYCILLVLNFFVGTDGVVAITVANLFYIFMTVFAYIGYNFALSLLSKRFKFGLSVFIILMGVLLLGTFALEILSVLGVVFTHTNNRISPNTNGGNS